MSQDETDLFGAASAEAGGSSMASIPPLAVRMRPRSLDEVRGQAEVLRPGSPLRRLIEGSGGAAGPLSAILWGPPGTGKTTLAHLVASSADREFVELSAVTAGVKDVRSVMEGARRARDLYGRQTVLFLDEIHRFTKAQQDALLPGVENRQVVLVAATTENPSFSVIAPLLSRSVLVTLVPLTDDEVADVLVSATTDERGLDGAYDLAEDAREHLVRLAGGDARRALTFLEAAAGVTEDALAPGAERPDVLPITLAQAEQAAAHAAVRYDRTGDQHYDVASALIKSMRGSDVDAVAALPRADARGRGGPALHRPADRHRRVGGRRPRRPHGAADRRRRDARRGPDRHARGADHPRPGGRPQRARPEVQRRLHRDQRGDRRRAGRQGRPGADPPAGERLRRLEPDRRVGGEGVGEGKAPSYVYAHDEPDGVARQQYLPDDLHGSTDYYRPTDRGFEARLQERWRWLRERLGRG